MKKIVLWLMSTVTVVVLLFGYHTSTSSTASAQGGNSSLATPVQGGSGTVSGSTGSGGTAAASSAAPSSAAASSSAASSGGTSGTYTGTEASTRWGPVEVQLTVSNGKITKVSVPVYPDNNGRDQEINARALPVLVQETLKAQSASIDMVSGATVTSDGYLQSLQSALDKAGL